MVSKKIILKNETGLHARPASELVKLTSKFKSNIDMIVGEKRVNAKSMLGIMSAGITANTEIIIECDGEDEEKALKEIEEAFENKFGEN